MPSLIKITCINNQLPTQLTLQTSFDSVVYPFYSLMMLNRKCCISLSCLIKPILKPSHNSSLDFEVVISILFQIFDLNFHQIVVSLNES